MVDYFDKYLQNNTDVEELNTITQKVISQKVDNFRSYLNNDNSHSLLEIAKNGQMDVPSMSELLHGHIHTVEREHEKTKAK